MSRCYRQRHLASGNARATESSAFDDILGTDCGIAGAVRIMPAIGSCRCAALPGVIKAPAMTKEVLEYAAARPVCVYSQNHSQHLQH